VLAVVLASSPALVGVVAIPDCFPVTKVKVPAAGAVPPIAGGDARYVENPVPDTVLDADRVVNAPAAGVPPPMAPDKPPAA